MPLLQATDTEIVYGRTAANRLLGGVVGAFMLTLTTVLLVLVGSTLPPAAGHSPLERMQPFAFGGVLELFGLCLFICFQLTEDIILDLNTRTYRFRSGFPLLARWRTGPCSDIEDIVLRKMATRQGTAYRVALVWRRKPQGFWRAMLQDVRESIPNSLDSDSALPYDAAVSQMEVVARSLALPGITGHAEAEEQVRQRALRMTALGTIVAVLLSCGLFGPQALLASQLDRQGHTITGVVTNITRGAKSNILEFTYYVPGYQMDGRPLHGHENVGSDTFQKVQIGDNVTVTYLPDYPGTCRTAYSTDSFGSSVGILCLTAGGSLVGGIFYSLYRSRR